MPSARQYRGKFNPCRAPSLDCGVEDPGQQSHAGRWCGNCQPDFSYCCTRPRGHSGDHATVFAAYGVAGRWGQDGSFTDREEGPQ